jgi:hypothetical protein
MRIILGPLLQVPWLVALGCQEPAHSHLRGLYRYREV